MYCKHCGKSIDANVSFCGHCGEKTTQPTSKQKPKQSGAATKKAIFITIVSVCLVLTVSMTFAIVWTLRGRSANIPNISGTTSPPANSLSPVPSPTDTVSISPTHTNTPPTSPESLTETSPVNTVEPTPVNAGDYIVFGGYSWLILEADDDRALILSEHVLEARAYHSDYTDITWEQSDLRKYLNESFYNSFTQEDRARILGTYISNANNQWFGSYGGNDTIDMIFLLSLEETTRYLGDSGQLSNRPDFRTWLINDRYNSGRVAKYANNTTSQWWLRSPGSVGNTPAYVAEDGILSVTGHTYYVANRSGTDLGVGVRPALWISLRNDVGSAPNVATPPPITQTQPSVEIIQIGDIIQFGGYDWRALDVQDGKALVLSEYVLEARAYNDVRSEVTWESSSLRRWLNGEFYNNFSPDDRSRIVETLVTNADNNWFRFNGGNDTTDMVFVLSIDEVTQYFGDSGQLRNRPSENTLRIDDQYNSERIARYTTGSASWWWLRSPGGDNDCAAYIDSDGILYLICATNNHASIGVRPAIWLIINP